MDPPTAALWLLAVFRLPRHQTPQISWDQTHKMVSNGLACNSTISTASIVDGERLFTLGCICLYASSFICQVVIVAN